jgi:hypothetical protein
MELGEHLYAFLHSQLLEKEAAMAFYALAWQKNKFCTLGYNEFDFFLENKEYRPFDGCKIEI